MTEISVGHSPLRYVLDPPVGLKHALFASFTFDPAWFEQFIVGRLRAFGAETAVVADASMVEFDPYRSNQAGRSYALSLVSHPGAFHPKVIALIGDERVVVGIGSGNLTQAGWHRNDELWTFIDSPLQSIAQPAAEALRWFTQLTDVVSLPDPVQKRLVSATKATTGGAASPAQFLSNLERPILEQLPYGPVDELVLYAPFLDSGSRGLRAVLDRFQPKHASLSLQRTTMADGESLEKLASDRGVELRWIEDEPYRHGKLIEWCVDGRWSALTGSANLTMAALGRPARSSNIETAIVTTVEQSLMASVAEASTSSPSHLTLRRDPPGEAESAVEQLPTITFALLENDATTVFLSASADGLTIEAADPSSPDAWSAVPATGTGTVRQLALPLAVGTWLRVRIDNQVGRRVPISGTQSLRPPRSHLSGTYRRPNIDEIIEDQQLADRFLRDYQAVIAKRLSSGTASSQTNATSKSYPSAPLSWEEYLDEINERFGPSLAAFSLGLPFGTANTVATANHDFDDETLAESEAVFEDDEAEDEALTATARAMITALPDEARAKYRGQLEKIASNQGDPLHPFADPGFHLLVLRLTLTCIAARFWSSSEQWAPMLLDHLTRLSEPVDAPDELKARRLAAAAVVGSAIHHAVPRLPETTLSLKVERELAIAAPPLVEVNQELVDAYCEIVHADHLPGATSEQVEQFIEHYAVGDTFDRAVETLADFGDGIIARAAPPWLMIPEAAGDARTVGFLALRELDPLKPCGVKVGPLSNRTMLLWSAPRLAIVQPTKNPSIRRATIHELPSGFGPQSYATIDGLPKHHGIRLEESADWRVVLELISAVENQIRKS